MSNSSTASTPMYLISLTGARPKDNRLKLADKAIYDWILHGGDIPQVVKDGVLGWGNMEDASELDAWSAQPHDANDRALLYAPPLKYTFRGVAELSAYLKAQNMEIAEEYQGFYY